MDIHMLVESMEIMLLGAKKNVLVTEQDCNIVSLIRPGCGPP